MLRLTLLAPLTIRLPGVRSEAPAPPAAPFLRRKSCRSSSVSQPRTIIMMRSLASISPRAISLRVVSHFVKISLSAVSRFVSIVWYRPKTWGDSISQPC